MTPAARASKERRSKGLITRPSNAGWLMGGRRRPCWPLILAGARKPSARRGPRPPSAQPVAKFASRGIGGPGRPSPILAGAAQTKRTDPPPTPPHRAKTAAATARCRSHSARAQLRWHRRCRSGTPWLADRHASVSAMTLMREREEVREPRPPTPPPAAAAQHERWNYWTVALYLSCYRVGLVLVQPDTVLPVLLLHVTDNPLLLGAPSSLYLFFWTFPQSLSAFYTARVRETKPLVSLLMVLHALPWAVLSFYLVFSWRRRSDGGSPLAMVLAVYAAVIAYSILGGASMPGYMTMVGKTLMARSRIKLMGNVWCTSVVLTFGASMLMRRLIAEAPFPLNFAIVFLTGFAAFCMAVTFWGETKEPPTNGNGQIHSTLRGYYRDVFTSIRRDRVSAASSCRSRCPGSLCRC